MEREPEQPLLAARLHERADVEERAARTLAVGRRTWIVPPCSTTYSRPGSPFAPVT